MKASEAFWDTSALVPLCILDHSSQRIGLIAMELEPVVWWTTSIEINSAIARRHLVGALDDTMKRNAIQRLAALQETWREIAPSESIRQHAEALLYRYSLRAADSLQLAAAFAWCKLRPSGHDFISSDLRLCEAASLAGFSVLRL